MTAAMYMHCCVNPLEARLNAQLGDIDVTRLVPLNLDRDIHQNYHVYTQIIVVSRQTVCKTRCCVFVTASWEHNMGSRKSLDHAVTLVSLLSVDKSHFYQPATSAADTRRIELRANLQAGMFAAGKSHGNQLSAL